MYTSVSANDVFRRLPCAFSKDLDSEAMKSAPSSKASGGQTYIPGYSEKDAETLCR